VTNLAFIYFKTSLVQIIVFKLVIDNEETFLHYTAVCCQMLE